MWTSLRARHGKLGSLALTGFHYSGVSKRITFTPNEGRFFWSNGYAWGTYSIKNRKYDYQIELTIEMGELKLEAIQLRGIGEIKLKKLIQAPEDGKTWTFFLPRT